MYACFLLIFLHALWELYLPKDIDLAIFTRRNIWLRNSLSLAVTLASFPALHLLLKSHLAHYYNFSRPPSYS